MLNLNLKSTFSFIKHLVSSTRFVVGVSLVLCVIVFGGIFSCGENSNNRNDDSLKYRTNEYVYKAGSIDNFREFENFVDSSKPLSKSSVSTIDYKFEINGEAIVTIYGPKIETKTCEVSNLCIFPMSLPKGSNVTVCWKSLSNKNVELKIQGPLSDNIKSFRELEGSYTFVPEDVCFIGICQKVWF